MAKKETATRSFVLRVGINGQLQWIISEALRKNGRLKKKNADKTDGKE